MKYLNYSTHKKNVVTEFFFVQMLTRLLFVQATSTRIRNLLYDYTCVFNVIYERTKCYSNLNNIIA